MILGVGTDLVSLTGMAEQLATPGSQFLERFLTRREHRVVHRKATPLDQAANGSACRCAQDDAAVERIGTLWAIKEAVVKAWSAALFGKAPPISVTELEWSEIEVIHDHWQRPAIELHGRVAEMFSRTVLGTALRPSWHVSASRDQDFAMATVILSGA